MSPLPALALLVMVTLAGPDPGRGDGVFVIDGRPVEVVDVTRRTVVDLDAPDAVLTMPPPTLPPTVAPSIQDEGGPSRPAPPPPTARPRPTPRPAPVRDSYPWVPRVVLGLLLAGVVLVLGRAALDGRRRRSAQEPVN